MARERIDSGSEDRRIDRRGRPGEGSLVHPSVWKMRGAAVLLLALLFLLLLGLNMGRELNHDEHQFIAGAALIARNGLTPYQDFAFFHVPLQIYLYALLYTLFDTLLLSSRLLSVFFGWLTVVLVFAYAWQRERTSVSWSRWRFSALAALWMAALPLFTYTSGRAWNHDLPLFLMLLAVTVHGKVCASQRTVAWFVLSGVLMGLATATRLSFALTVIPFLLLIWLGPARSVRGRVADTSLFAAGLLFGLAPVLALFFRAPQSFLFGNVEYVGLNTRFFQRVASSDAGMEAARGLPSGYQMVVEKLAYFGALLVEQPTTLITLLALAVSLWPLRRLGRRPSANVIASEDDHGETDTALRLRLGFVLLLMLFALIGAFGATPSQPQYFYPLFPLALLGLVDAFSAWPSSLRAGGIYAYVLGGLATVLVAIPVYTPGLALLNQPNEWLPTRVHRYGQFIEDLVSNPGAAGAQSTTGNVLTLAPLYALEGGASIYPEFATGPFAWRVSPLVSDTDRARFHIVGTEELSGLLESDPPRAILTGVEEDDGDEEVALIEYAEDARYMPVNLADESILWLSPLAQWGDAIQLGGVSMPDRLLQPGADFLLTFYLQSLRPLEANYNRQVRVVGVDDQEVLRADGWPFGSGTSQWSVGDVWPDGQVFTLPEDALPGYYRIDVRFYDPNTTDDLGVPVTAGYLVVGDPDAAQVTTESVARFGDFIELTNATLTQSGSAAAGVVFIDLGWRIDEAVAGDYTRFVHLIDADGQLVAQVDSFPLDGFLPTSAWNPRLPVHETVHVDLPTNLPGGDYSVVVGLYDLATLERLPVSVGEVAVGDSIPVGQLEIER
jgi:4-amino-4-deoxy-L-arabinose transferase-like glycosyltransferase